MNRRNFLGNSGAGLAATMPVLSSIAQLRMAANAYSQTGGNYKALVCVFLGGGNDSFNMLAPTTAAEYSAYASVRSNMALPTTGTDALLNITPSNTPGRTFGVNNAMPNMRDLFSSGDLAYIANTGVLVEPTTVATYDSGTALLPSALFSHRDQQTHWYTASPTASTPTGWGGRTADLLNSMNTSSEVSMNISLDGISLFQTGNQVASYAIDSDGSVGLRNDNITSTSNFYGARNAGVNNILEKDYGTVLRRAYADSTKEALDTHSSFSSAFGAASPTTTFPTSNIGQDLEAVAKIISQRSTLGAERQIFFVSQNVYDMHANLLTDHPVALGELDAALKAFWDELGAMGLRDEVTTFQCSDFSRTLRSNGNGTDHGWGGNLMVMGGQIDGGKIYGDYPTQLGLGTGLDVGTNGRMLPTTSNDEYFCELLQWFGVAPSEMSAVLPHIANFYNPYSSTPPIGFFS